MPTAAPSPGNFPSPIPARPARGTRAYPARSRAPAPAEVLRAGLSTRDGADPATWYPSVRAECLAFSAAEGVPFRRVVAVTALLSPRVEVARNGVFAARYLIATRDGAADPWEGINTVPSVKRSVEVWEAAGGEKGPGPYGLIKGPKVAAFARAIEGDDSAVVVDVWVARAIRLKGRPARKNYQRAVEQIERLAQREGVSPRVAQAALWYGARNFYGAAFNARSDVLALGVEWGATPSRQVPFPW